jgi:hypothetical protein
MPKKLSLELEGEIKGLSEVGIGPVEITKVLKNKGISIHRNSITRDGTGKIRKARQKGVEFKIEQPHPSDKKCH